MKQFVAIIVGLHVLAHSVFGCCGHVFASTSQSATGHCRCARTAAHCHEKERAHDGHDHSQPDSSQQFQLGSCENYGMLDQGQFPGEHHACPHASCHWLVSQTVTTNSLVDFGFYFMVTVPLPAAFSLQSEWQHSTDFAVGRICAPPLRLHLAVGVLLI